MSENNSRSFRGLTAIVIYVVAIAAALTIATLRSRASSSADTVEESFSTGVERQPTSKPYFSLSTHRTYGTGDNPRLWVDYQGVDHMDFRVYQVKDPRKFFTELKDPHQMGEDEKEEVAGSLPRRKSFLEKVRSFKRWAYSGVKTFVRVQLKRNSREAFNQKFRKKDDPVRTPLNVADYARVPLLNPDLLVTSWREQLPPLENEYDRRMVPLGKRSAGVYLVEAVANDLRAYTVVVVTDLTMVNKTTTDGELLIYSVDRKTGEPRPGAEVEVVREKKVVVSGTTDSHGILRTKIDKPKKADQPEGEEVAAEEGAEGGAEEEDLTEEGETESSSCLILVKQSNNFAISDLGSFYFGGYEEEEEAANIKGYIYTDRPVYRPAHKVSFKGIVRVIDKSGAYKSPNTDTATVTIEDPNNATIYTKELPLSPRGTFKGEIDISEEASLGSYYIAATVEGGRATGNFQIAEYKKPEYKVTISAPGKFAPAGQKTNFSIDARYFFGAPVANAEVKYYIYRSRYYAWGFGEDDSEFTGEAPDEQDEYSSYYGGGTDMVQEGEGTLDARGHLGVEFPLPQNAENDASDYTYRIEAQVTDSARRTIDGSASVVATRGTIVANANPERYVYYKGDVAKIRVSTTDYEGRPLPAKVQLQFVERTWTKREKKEDEDEYSYPQYDVHERVVGTGYVDTDSQGLGFYDYETTEDGSLSIKTVVDDGGKQVASMGGYLWVTDNQSQWSESSYFSEDHNSIKLVPDKKSYRAGETAHVLAILPTDNAHLLVTTELMSVMSIQHVSSPGKSVMLNIPIVANYAPNVFLNVAYVKNGDMYSSDQRLVVPARDKMLNLEIISNKKEYKPRETASYTILARNADGAPVSGAEVSLGVVDESIYSVAQDHSGNIRSEFYGMRYNSVETSLAISYSFTGYSGDRPIDDLVQNKKTYQLADFKNEASMVQPMIRKNFKDTAFWQPDVVTGADGKATVKVDLPDNLTTWRATARGVTADTKVGATKYKVVARKDVIMRLETPRFVTQGDTVTLSGIVHNYLDADKSTQISLEVNGAQLRNSGHQTVTVKKQGEHRIDWQISAPEVGEIKLLAKALTDTESDAVELPLTVVPRGLHQVRNESWTLSEENAEKSFSLPLPPEADARARILRIEVTPSVAGTLFGALDYLTTYPYGCTEQTMSSFLPNVIVTQALKDVKTSSLGTSNDLEKKVRKGLDRLYAFQHDDGGWGWWKDDQSDPFMTAYVVSGLTWAKRAGYDVAEDRIDSGRTKLKQMLDAGATEAGTAIDLETRSFMVYALEETGGSDHYVEKVFSERGNLQPYGRALLALTLKQRKDDKRARDVAGEIERTVKADNFYASWESRRKEMLDFAEQNDTEATALSLKALARIKPDSQLLPKVARWLVSNRRNSYYWSSTKDTAFAIFGLIDYLKVSRELSPDYDFEVYLNGENVLTEHVSSAGVSQKFSVNRKGGEVAGANEIRVVKRGKGLLYFATSLDYYTGEEDVAARGTSDLNITREYLRLRVVEDGYKLKWAVDPLSGDIRSGDVLVVKLKLNGSKARHLMIEDPIPAGAEQVENVGNLNLDYTSGNGWSDWYSSREFRDNRTVFFLDYFDGDATLQYAMRVQVPGQFRVAPARAELMYRSTTQSNTTSGRMSFLERK